MASVPVGFASTQENTNYARLYRLLSDLGYKVLRETFDNIHPPANLHKVLSSTFVRTTLRMLSKSGDLSYSQSKKLFPDAASNVSSANFDFTLLVVLLENICGLRFPVAIVPWNRLPYGSDNSVEANIVRVEFYRNIVYANATKASVDDKTFNSLWQKISRSILALASETNNYTMYATSISRLKTEYTDPAAHHKNLLSDLKKDDGSLEYMFKELKGMRIDLFTVTI